MAVRADASTRIVVIDTILDLATAQVVRDAALQIGAPVVIDLHEVRDVHDSALAYLVTALRVADCDFTLRGLSWPHTKLLEYLGVGERSAHLPR